MAGANGSGRSGQPSAPPPIPVTLAPARIADVPVTLNGLGTVQPINNITVRSRVDGEVTSVAFQQGQMVREGDVLVQIDDRAYRSALEQAQAKRTQDEASLHDAALNFQRYSALANQQFASRQQLDTQRSTVEQLGAQIKGDQATIENARTQLSYATIRAPISGKTGFRLVDPGNIVHASDTNGIVTIVQLQPIFVVLTAPEDDVPRINKALAAGRVPVTAFGTDGTPALSEGELTLVNNQVDQASGTISLKATFPNADNALWPGLSVATRTTIDILRGVVVVPEDAIRRGPNGLFTYVVGDDNKAHVSPVEVGQQGDGVAVVTKGVTAGQKVVVAGYYKLQEGSVVQPLDAAAPATADASSAGRGANGASANGPSANGPRSNGPRATGPSANAPSANASTPNGAKPVGTARGTTAQAAEAR